MISYIKGELAAVGEEQVVVEVQGIGYGIFMPGQAMTMLPPIGSEVKIHTYLNVREDAMQLFGFLTKDDLKVFRLLIGVNGIGPKGGLNILSKMTPDDLRFAVLAGDVKAISAAPGIGKKPVFHEDGTITSDGTTVLGADDLTGVIAILEGIRAVQEAGIPHRDIEILFAAAEEPFTRGSSEFDFSQMKAKESYVLDVTGPVGTAILQAPTILSFEAAVKGRAAHAGFEPEKGIHAIQAAARAIAALKLGHVDEETTLNVGLISGGSVVNAVPELCTCRGEIRSYSHEKAMETLEDVRAVFETAVKEAGAELSFTYRLHVKAFHLEPDAPVAIHFAEACRTLGIEPKFGSTFGGSDGNTMMQHGIPCAVLSCGMYDVHSVREYAKVGDIVNGARLIAELITQGQEASIE